MKFSFQLSAFSFFVSIVCLTLLAGCSTTKTAQPIDPEINLIAAAANKAFAHGQVEQAVRQYARAVERARAADATADIADQAYNLAACLLILKQPNEARPLLQEARAAVQQLGRKDFDCRLLEAKAARMSGKRDEALRLADQLLADGKALNTSEKLQVLLIKAQLHCDAGQSPTAEQTEIRLLALDVADPAIQAEVAQLWGHCDLLEKEFAHAGAAFDREAAFLQKNGRFREMAQALARAGAAWQADGYWTEAADRLYRAARSLFAQGDTVGALRQIEPALVAAKKSGQEALATRIVALFEDIKKSVPATKKKD